MQAGHRSVPHTADTRIEAWAATRDVCVAELVAAMVETFADVRTARRTGTATFEITYDSDEQALVGVLGEIIFLMDTADAIPVCASVVAGERKGYTVSLDVTGIDQVELVGAVPKAVSLHDLRFEERPDGGWSCGVTLDV